MQELDTDLATAGKVGRVIDERELSGVAEELVTRWTGEAGERASLRELARFFNERVLGAALADAGADPTGDPSRLYRILTGEEGSAGDRTDLRNRLERAGVDVDAVESDFVSHQTVHTFLTDHLDVEYHEDRRPQLQKDRERIDRLESRLAAVADDVVARSGDAGRIRVGDPDVLVETRVLCAECGNDYTLQGLLDREGCGCAD